ncbi:uncharacterized protein LOC141657029 [Silene latifolia]|uniref:uncharacterized protein LOC141657029 n=1 Tax=Silene latifolia TaxID=37657 RepID=UPI003D7723D5
MGSLIGDKRHLANGNTSFLTPSPKCKRRKVSAVRDFPCGLNTSEFDEGDALKRITRANMSEQCSEVNGRGKKSKSDDASSKSIVRKKHGYDAQDNQKCYLTRSKGKSEKLEEKSMLIAPCPKKMKSDGVSSNNIDLREKSRDTTQVDNGVKVQGLMCAKVSKRTAELSPSRVSAKVSKGKKHGYDAQYSQKRYLTRSKDNAKNLREKSMLTGEFSQPLALRDDEDRSEKHDVELLLGPHHCGVSIPPYVPCSPIVMERDRKFEDESEIRIFSDRNPNMDFRKDKDEKVKSKSEGALTNSTELQEKSSDITRVEKGVIVQGLMCASSSPWRQVETPVKLIPSHISATVINGRKHDCDAQDSQKRYLTRSKGDVEMMTEKSMLVAPCSKKLEAGKLSQSLAPKDDEDYERHFKLLPGPHNSDASVPPFVACSSEVTEREKKFEDESEIRSFTDRLKNPFVDIVKDKDEKIKSKSDDASSNSIVLQEKSNDITGVEKGVIVQGLMCASSDPWRQMERPVKLSASCVSARVSNEKKRDYDAQDNQKRYLTRTKSNAEKMARKSLLIAPFPKELETGHSDVSICPFATCSPEVTEEEKKFEDQSEIKHYQNWLKNLIVNFVKDKDEKINSKSDGASNNIIELQEKSGDITEVEKGVIEQGMSASSSPGRQVERPTKLSPSCVSARVSSEKKHDYDAKDNQKRYLTRSNSNAEEARKSMLSAPSTKELETGKLSRSVARKVDEDFSEDEGRDFEHLPGPRNCDVSVPPFVACSPSGRGARTKVRATLRLFQGLVRKILQGEESNLNELGTTGKTAHIHAANVLKEQGKYINTEKVVGAVPGVEIGDIFSCRLELAIIGIHTPLQSDIDTVKKGNTCIATSVVASGGYDNGEDYSDVLIYTGQGENPMGVDKKAEDQKLERGNLALKNCIDEKSLVRVIRGLKEAKPSDNGDERTKMTAAYTYDGLYTVKRYWYELGPHGNWVYKFELSRISGQHQLAWKELKHSNKSKMRIGCRVDDISKGREKLPICAVNTVDDEKPPSFTYITGTMYPDWCRPLPLTGCNCKGRCSNRCACAKKNGGEIPYNLSGAIVEAKPLVYECGPSCKCPPSCPNRVSQHGIKLPLEIFKTKSMGWGVRCRSPIPSGSFICEYIGELLDDKEAEQRVGSDEYLFDIGQNYNGNSVSDGLPDLMPHIPSTDSNAVENVGFTIDAARYGNIGRFVNHSCSPNLYAQNVLYDHEDERIPHVMLFAAENIPPLKELTYDYNYTVDQVFDSKGNIKKKNCYCGSAECTGRLY